MSTLPSDFQMATFRAANARLLFRVKRRENWLALQVLIQTALIILTLTTSLPLANEILILSMPVTFTLAMLYISEDRLVAHIVSYLNALAEDRAVRDKTKWLNLESSPEGRGYVSTTLPIRLLAQIAGFLLLPLTLITYRLLLVSDWQGRHTFELTLAALLGVVIAWLLFSSYRRRRSG